MGQLYTLHLHENEIYNVQNLQFTITCTCTSTITITIMQLQLPMYHTLPVTRYNLQLSLPLRICIHVVSRVVGSHLTYMYSSTHETFLLFTHTHTDT